MRKGIKNQVIDKLKGIINIRNDVPEITSSTRYYYVHLTINEDKDVYASVWISDDDNIGETDFGFEIIENESDELTDEERKAVERYINNREIF